MKKLFLLTVFLLTTCKLLIAQTGWTQYYDPFAVDGYWGHDVIKCSNGGYIVNGSCYIEDPWNPGNYLEHYGFTMKIDIDGNLEWVKKDTVSFIPMNQASAILQSSDGGFISAVIPWLAGQGALIKRDADGNREWTINPDMWVDSMINTTGNNIVIAGAGNSGDLKKISQDGNIMWQKPFDGTILKSIFKSQDEGFLLTGYKDANGGPFDMDAIVIKTDSDGDTLWTRTYDGFQDWDQGNSIIETTNDEILLVGKSRESNFRSIHGLIWNLSSQGETNWLELTYSDFGWEHLSVAQYQVNEYIAFCFYNYEGKFYGFDGDYNILWEMETTGGAGGDRCFCVDDEYIIWPESGTSFILHKAIPDQNSVNNNIINKEKFLLSNYPNPFNPSTTISYTLSESGFIDLSIYNTKGQKIKSLVNDFKNQGVCSIEWNGLDLNNKNVGSGIYFVNMKINNRLTKTHKILLIK